MTSVPRTSTDPTDPRFPNSEPSTGPYTVWPGYDDEPDAGQKLFVRLLDAQGRRVTLLAGVVMDRLNELQAVRVELAAVTDQLAAARERMSERSAKAAEEIRLRALAEAERRRRNRQRKQATRCLSHDAEPQ